MAASSRVSTSGCRARTPTGPTCTVSGFLQRPVLHLLKGPVQGPASGVLQRPVLHLLKGPVQGPASGVLQRPVLHLLKGPVQGPVSGFLHRPVLQWLKGPVQGPAQGAAEGSFKDCKTHEGGGTGHTWCPHAIHLPSCTFGSVKSCRDMQGSVKKPRRPCTLSEFSKLPAQQITAALTCADQYSRCLTCAV